MNPRPEKNEQLVSPAPIVVPRRFGLAGHTLSQIGAILHIAIDAHSVGAQLAGNESYAVNLIEGLAEIDQTNLYTLYVTKPAAIDRFADRWSNFKVRQTLPHTPLVRLQLTLSAVSRRHAAR